MAKAQEGDQHCSPGAVEKLTGHFQEKVNSGWTLPSGWVFRGLTLYFHESEDGQDLQSDNTKASQSHQNRLARNTARFAGANVSISLEDSAITHIIVGPETPASAVSKIRKTLSNRKKLPHIVTVDWIEESWKERTLLDEERKFSTILPKQVE